MSNLVSLKTMIYTVQELLEHHTISVFCFENMHVFRLWIKMGEKPCTHKGNNQATLRKVFGPTRIRTGDLLALMQQDHSLIRHFAFILCAIHYLFKNLSLTNRCCNCTAPPHRCKAVIFYMVRQFRQQGGQAPGSDSPLHPEANTERYYLPLNRGKKLNNPRGCRVGDYEAAKLC